MITLKNISLRRGAKILLDQTSVSLNPGEKVGLVGRNGAGKSSLIKCAVGVLVPSAGEVLLNGNLIQDVKQSERAKRIGYIPQEPGDLLYKTSVGAESLPYM